MSKLNRILNALVTTFTFYSQHELTRYSHSQTYHQAEAQQALVGVVLWFSNLLERDPLF